MAQEAPLAINIKAIFTGKKAFKEADTATSKLSKTAGKLAAGLGVAFSAKAVTQFAKASAKAFIEDEASTVRLLKAVENLGMGFEGARITNFIADLENTSKVADDVLRPSFQSLLSVTGSVSKSQELLKLALDISAGSGENLTTVTNDLGAAFVGKTKALTKYNTGLTAVELSTTGFTDIQARLNDQYTGQNSARLNTYQGQIDTLNLAYGNMQETIGKGLVDSFALLSGDTGITGAANAMDTFARFTADAIYGLSTLLNMKPTAGSASVWEMITGTFGDVLKYGPLGQLSRLGERQREAARLKQPVAKNKEGIPLTIAMSDADKQRAVFEKQALARAKLLEKLAKSQAAAALATAKAKKDQLALDKAALALGKGKDVFDMEAIQLNAAMINTTQTLGKVTSQAQLLAVTNDLARLRIKQDMLDLEDAISRKDVEAATAAAARLNKDLVILGTLSNQAIKLADIKGILAQIAPKSLIDISNLNDAIAKITELNRLQGLKVSSNGTVTGGTTGTVTGGTTGGITGGTAAGDNIPTIDKATAALASIDAIIEYADAATARANAFADLLDMQTAAANAKYAANAAAQAALTLNFNAPIYTVSDAEFAANVQKAIQNQNRFGNNLDYAGAI